VASQRAAERIQEEVISWKGVTHLPHRFGGVEFRLGKKELGHIHRDKLVDIPFPMNVRTELVGKGEVKKHHVMPESGWVTFHIKKEEDIQKASALFRRAYDIAVASAQKRKAMGYGAE
jgi:hypothetical protein